MAIPNCVVDQYNYDLGCLAPAILIIAVLSFMKKRVRLKPDWCNGRPGLPVPVDFLGDERNRFIIPFAFGATAASSFNMFFGQSATSRDLQASAWAKAFRGILMTMVYGIINYPYLGCLNAEYKIVGYTIGLIYSFIRFIVDLFLYFGCTFDEQSVKAFKEMNIGYVFYAEVITNIPVVVCTLILVGSYSILLYKEIKKLNVQGLPSFPWLLQKEEDTTITLAGKTERAHVDLLFSNQLHQAGKRANRAPNQICTWCNSLKNWIYVTRPDFKFSTQFLSSFVVSCIFVYQLTALLLMIISFIFLYIRNIKPQTIQEAIFRNVALPSEDYFIASVVLASLFAILQLCFFLRSHRKDILKTYRTRKGLLPDEILRPKMLVGKSLRFCGYQVAFTAVGLLMNVLSVFLLLLPIYILSLLCKFKSTEEMLSLVRESFLDILPYISTPILVWISMTLLSLFVFKDDTYPDISITINNRRLFGIMSYFFFFFNILVGLWSGLLRIVKGAVMGLVFLPRIDRTSMMTGFRRFDRAYMAYIGFLCVLVAFRHPVMLCFCQLLLEGVRRRETGQSIASRPRVSGKALNRWFLAVLLIRNPSLVRYRKQDVSPASTSAVQLKIPPSFLEDNLTQPECLKLLTEEKIEMDHVGPGTKHT